MGMFLYQGLPISAVTPPDPAFAKGYLDACTINGVSGWAGASPTHIEVWVNGSLYATVATNVARPDVVAAEAGPFPGVSFANCGFSYTFSPALDPTQTYVIAVKCQGTTLENGSQTLVGGGGGGGTAGYITDMALQPGAVVQQGIAATMPNNDSELASHPSVIFYEPMDSSVGIKSRWVGADKFYGPGVNGLPSIDNPSVFTTDAKSSARLLQLPIQAPLNAGDGIGGTACSWHHAVVDQTITELYCRYLLVIETDVQPTYDAGGTQINGMTEIGVKLPGLAGAYENAGQWNYNGNIITQDGGWSARLWHAAPPVANVFPFRWYIYDWQANQIEGNQFGAEYPLGQAAARGGQVYCLETRIKLNTLTAVDGVTGLGTPVADGILEAWVDGVKVYSDPARKIRGNTQANFEELFANIFHGGHLAPIGRITYRMGAMCVSKVYIGPPKRVVSNYRTPASDAFFAGLTLNTWTALPNSAMTNLIPQMRSDYLEYGVIAAQGTHGRPVDANGLSGLFNWGGAAWNDVTGDLLLDAGGHNSTNNNGLYKFSPELAAGGTGADAYGSWRVVKQPSLYTQADFDAWILTQPNGSGGFDCHFELGWGYPNDDGTWRDGQPTSRHSYNSPVVWQGGHTYIRSSARLSKNGFWLYDVSSGSYSFVAGNGFFGNSSSSYLQGNNVVDETKNVLLGFQNWPNGASIGVRRYDLNTKTDLPPIDLTNQVLSQDSNFTAGIYYTQTTWCQTGAGCMVGREFHYAMSEGSQLYFRVNIDTWVAKELKLTGLPVRIGTALVYCPDNGYLYAISCDDGRLLRGNPFTGVWESAPAAGNFPIVDANLLVGVYGRFFYYSARKVLCLVSASNDNVRVMKVA